MNSPRPSAFNRFCAAFVVAALVLQPLGAYAAPITSSSLAQIPLQGLNPVKSNIMFTMDDSQSMSLATLPDYIGSLRACRDPNGLAVFCNTDVTGAFPPWRSKDVNRIYYDPSITYNVGRRFDGSDLPLESTAAGTWTSVFRDGFAGYPVTNTSASNLINLATEYPDEVFCWKPDLIANTDPTADDLATAKTDGAVCRYNGKAYPSITRDGYTTAAIPAGYNYPNNTSTAPCANTDANKCVFGRRPVANPTQQSYVLNGPPYYYTIANVKFCPTAISLPTNRWGVNSAACKTRWFENSYVSYGAGGFDPTAFVRVDINPADAAQMSNFAKWYAFNRTRILAMKTAGGIAFSALGEGSRVGFNTLNNYTQNFLPAKDFTDSNKDAWFTNFYSAVPNDGVPLAGNTPSIDAMWRIGEYFSNRDTTLPAIPRAGFDLGRPTLPPLPNPGDPLAGVTGRCQSNYHLLATDGYWNQPVPSSYRGIAGPINNYDLTVPSLANLPGATGFTPGQDFPKPYREGSTVVSNTMADVAMYYWINDLRPDLANDVKKEKLTAPWQHVTFYGLALGAEGTLDYPTGVDTILQGLAAWPQPLGAGTIDDVWHAAVNGHGKYFNAQNAQQLAESIVAALADTADQGGTGAAVGLAGAQFTATKSFGYRTSYDADWSGDVRKYALDSATGALPANAKPVWSAATQLDAMAAGDGWTTNRRIVTMNDSNVPTPFRAGSISAAQLASLNAGWSSVTPTPTADAVLNYLRGDKSNEGTGTSNFRIRSHILGDLVSSGAVPVGAPSQPYDDGGNPGYSAFVTDKKLRTQMVYAGANDGMLHAFHDCVPVEVTIDGKKSITCSPEPPNDPNKGKEAWAFIPKALFSSGDPNDTSHTPSSAFQLGALSYRQAFIDKDGNVSGGIPPFQHRFYVNATPRIWDVDFQNTNTNAPPTSGNDWRTILVGGLGAGGRAVYALDVTNPVAPEETESDIVAPATKRVLWEFTDANLGYVFDAPTLVKTKRYGWVALVASGYNNPGGKGFLYVLNPKDGTLLKKLSPDVAGDLDPDSAKPSDAINDANPRGLSTIRAFTASRKDPYVLQAYGGDLKGNVWRFDLSDLDESKWKVALIAKLTDPNGKAQAITTGVRIEIDQNNNVDRYIFVGTGKLLDQADLDDDSITNTLYVIRDGTRTAAGPVPAKPYSRSDPDLKSVNGAVSGGFTGTAIRGWYQDAVDSTGTLDPTQKIVTDVFADVQTVVFSFSKPSDDPCETALSSNLFARDLNTGNSVIQSQGGDVVPSINDIGAIAGVALIQGASGTGSAASGDVRVQVTTMKGQVVSFGVKLTGGLTLRHRVSWRLLNRN